MVSLFPLLIEEGLGVVVDKIPLSNHQQIGIISYHHPRPLLDKEGRVDAPHTPYPLPEGESECLPAVYAPLIRHFTLHSRHIPHLCKVNSRTTTV